MDIGAVNFSSAQHCTHRAVLFVQLYYPLFHASKSASIFLQNNEYHEFTNIYAGFRARNHNYVYWITPHATYRGKQPWRGRLGFTCEPVAEGEHAYRHTQKKKKTIALFAVCDRDLLIGPNKHAQWIPRWALKKFDWIRPSYSFFQFFFRIQIVLSPRKNTEWTRVFSGERNVLSQEDRGSMQNLS